MNIPNILLIAEKLENYKEAPLGFNLGHWFTENDDPKASWADRDFANNVCKTVGCIAGWTVFHLASKFNSFDGYYTTASELLDISPKVADELFAPQGSLLKYDEISPLDAAKVLRHLATTGRVDWSIVVPNYTPER